MHTASNRDLIGSDNWSEPETRTPGYVWTFRVFLYSALALAVCFSGPITRVAAGCAILFGILADRDGLARHLMRLLGLGLAIWLSPAIGAPIGDWLGPKIGMSPLIGRGIAIILAGFAIMLAVGLLGRKLSRLARRRKTLRGADNMLGALLGTSEGALVVVSVCWLAAMFGEPLSQLHQRLSADGVSFGHSVFSRLDSLQTAMRDDPAGRLLTRVNPLPQIPAMQTAQHLAEVGADADALTLVTHDPRVRAFSQLPVVHKHLEALQNDAELHAAIREQDLGTIVRSDVLSDMLNDRELYEAVRTHWSELKGALVEIDVNDLKNGGNFKQMARSRFSRAQIDAARQADQPYRGQADRLRNLPRPSH